MKIRQISLILIIIFSMVLINSNTTSAAPGDTMAEAVQLALGTYNGTVDDVYQTYYHNFTAVSVSTYNITVIHSNFSDIPMYVFSETGSQIASNTSYYPPKSVIVSGYDHYNIRLYTGDFTTPIPDDYSIIISYYEAEPGESLNTAFTAVEGTQSGNLTSYDDRDYYNFTTTDTDMIYNFTLSHPSETYYSLYIYDSNMNLLDNNFDIAESKYIVLAGESKYVIGVFASEFSTTPNPYDLIITHVPQQVTEITTVITTETEIDERVSIQTSIVTQSFASFPIIGLLIILPVILIKRNIKS